MRYLEVTDGSLVPFSVIISGLQGLGVSNVGGMASGVWSNVGAMA